MSTELERHALAGHRRRALVDGLDRASGIYEQFSRLLRSGAARDRGDRPATADRRPTCCSEPSVRPRRQVLKQPDVLMLHHLLPGRGGTRLARPESRLLRAADRARQFALACNHRGPTRRAEDATGRLSKRCISQPDWTLDDLSGSTAGGLHLATMGGLWQALAFGFGGIRPRGETLLVEPRLSPKWSTSRSALSFRGAPLRLRIDRRGVTAEPSGWRIQQANDHWEVTPSSTRVSPRSNSCRSSRQVPILWPRLRRWPRLPRLRGRGAPRSDQRPPEHSELHPISPGSACKPSTGPVAERLVEAGEEDDVVALAIGARSSPASAKPLAARAETIATTLSKPVLVCRPMPLRRRASGGCSFPSRARSRARSRPAGSSSSTASRASTWSRCTSTTSLRFRPSPTSRSTKCPPGRGVHPALLPLGHRNAAAETRVGRIGELVPLVAEQCECDLVASGGLSSSLLAAPRLSTRRSSARRARSPRSGLAPRTRSLSSAAAPAAT